MATYDDATVLLQLLQWGATAGVEDALHRVFEPDFSVTPETSGPGADRAPGIVLAFFETAGALVKHGVLDIALLHDTYWISGAWSRVEGYARQARAESGEPRLYEHFESIARYSG